MNKTKKSLTNKLYFRILIALIILSVAGGITFLYLYMSDTSNIKSNSVKSSNVTTTDVQSELNNINTQSSTLDNEINSVSTGLNDQQTNLVY